MRSSESRFPLEFLPEVWHWQGWKSRLHSEGEEKWRYLNGVTKEGVIGNIKGAKYNSWSRVESSQNELRYFVMVLFATSAWLLHWGWCDDIVRCDIPRRVKSLFDNLAQNSFAWSVTRSSGLPKRQIHLSKMAAVMETASLFSKATSSTYFVKASVIQSMNFLPLSEVFSGPKRSACTHWPGSVGSGNGDRSIGGGQLLWHQSWHRWQLLRWVAMSVPGQ